MSIKEKAKNIKAIVFDVDGVLTDGGIIYDNSGMEIKRFNVKDGQIISHLKNTGFIVGAITRCPVFRRRFQQRRPPAGPIPGGSERCCRKCSKKEAAPRFAARNRYGACARGPGRRHLSVSRHR